MCNLVKFWHEFTQFQLVGPDKEFDLNIYREIQEAKVSSFALAVDFLLKGKDNESVYMIFYLGLLKEIDVRGPKHIVKIFEKSHLPKEELLCTFLGWFHSMVVHTASQADIVAYLDSELPYIDSKVRGKEG